MHQRRVEPVTPRRCECCLGELSDPVVYGCGREARLELDGGEFGYGCHGWLVNWFVVCVVVLKLFNVYCIHEIRNKVGGLG